MWIGYGLMGGLRKEGRMWERIGGLEMRNRMCDKDMRDEKIENCATK